MKSLINRLLACGAIYALGSWLGYFGIWLYLGECPPTVILGYAIGATFASFFGFMSSFDQITARLMDKEDIIKVCKRYFYRDGTEPVHDGCPFMGEWWECMDKNGMCPPSDNYAMPTKEIYITPGGKILVMNK